MTELDRLNRYEVGYKVDLPTNDTILAFKKRGFDFPWGENVLRAQVSVFQRFEMTRVTAAIVDSKEQTYMPGEKEIYFLQERLQKEEESFIWEYTDGGMMQRLTEAVVKFIWRIDLDFRHTPLQLIEYHEELPPFKEAYEAEMQNDGEYTYAKGSAGRWQFVRVRADSDFPWETLQNVAHKMFKNHTVQVFFNKETEKHRGEFILWSKS